MSTKITKTQLEKLIKEETEKILSEAYRGGIGHAEGESCGRWIKDEDAKQWARNNFGSLKSKIEDIISRASIPQNLTGFETLKKKVLFDVDFWASVVGSLAYAGRIGFTNRAGRNDGIDYTELPSFILKRLEKKVEFLDDNFDELDPYDGFAAGTFKSIPDSQFIANGYKKLIKQISIAFGEWICSGSPEARKGTPTPTPAPAPNKRDCAMAKKLIAQIQKLDSSSIPTDIGKLPEYIASIEKRVGQSFGQSIGIASQPPSLEEGFLDDIKAKAGSAMNSVKKAFAVMDTSKLSAKQKAIVYVANAYNCPDAAGGLIKPVKPPKKSGGTCGKFNKFAAQVTGQKDVKQAVKAIQEILVNLGYSVKEGETDSGFGPGKGMIPSTKLKSAGIDGRCGPGTMDAVKRFQGANKLSVDGIVGPNTYKVLVSVAKTGGNKKAAAAPAGASKADTLGIIKAYSFVYNTLRGRIVNSLQSKKTEGANGIATKLIDAVLPGLQTAGGNRYKLKNKTYSIDSPDFGSDLMAGLSALKSSASNVETATGIKSSEIIRIVDKASNTYMKSALEESKSYNLDFNKWSKLWK